MTLMADKPKETHFAEMDPTERALFNQHVQDLLTTIIASQRIPSVDFPLKAIEETSKTHRLLISKRKGQGDEVFINVRAEVAPSQIIVPENHKKDA